jgi:hypothetical protein
MVKPTETVTYSFREDVPSLLPARSSALGPAAGASVHETVPGATVAAVIGPVIGPVIGLVIGLLVLASAACSPSRPPKGDKLRLKGNKGAICLANRECASMECRGGRCTEKIEKVGLGLWCKSHKGCKDGLYCDTKAKKCAPYIQCEKLESKLKSCVADVYGKFRPSQVRRLRRMRGRSRRRFLRRSYRILRRILCRATRSKALPFKRAVKLKRAAEHKDCKQFAADFHAALKKS